MWIVKKDVVASDAGVELLIFWSVRDGDNRSFLSLSEKDAEWLAGQLNGEEVDNADTGA